MADYGEGYADPPGSSQGEESDAVADEKHDILASKRGSKDSKGKPKRKRSCPVYFGVKSYLHNFYEDHSFKDPSLYEDDDHRFLLGSDERRRRCTPIWWKIFLWLGMTLLLFGVIGIMIGYLVPARHVLIPSVDGLGDKAYVDQSAQEYNMTLDMCKLIGLILFCIGGVMLAMSLIFPSFLTHYCDDSAHLNEPDAKVPLYQGSSQPSGPMSPLQMNIPASSKVKGVQPTKKAEQQMLTRTE